MEYSQLNLSDFETRFLRILEPDASDGTIRAEVVTASLARVPKYSALSYTWGNEPLTKFIQVDDRDVPVARNVEAALKELNLNAGSLIWIDALCINQNDLYEKSYQVGIMHEIYNRANTVIAWLGEADANTELAIGLLNNIATVSKRDSKGSENTDLGKRYLTGAIRTSDDANRALQGLIDLLTRPFWERVWIIQEIAKARRVNVRCGRFQTTLEPIWRVFHHVPRINAKAIDLLDAINRFRSSQQSRHDGGGISLLEALLMTKRSRATDPRDRVYALLSLTMDGRELVPLAEYNTPLEMVFREITLRMLERRQQFTVMLLASRTFTSWHSTEVDDRRRLAVQWAELHDHVPEWIIRSVLKPELIDGQYNFVMKNKRIIISATYIATIVDCEKSSSDEGAATPDESEDLADRSSLIEDTVEAYVQDILYICTELSSGAWFKKGENKNAVGAFAALMRMYRASDKETESSGSDAINLLLTPFQRLGPLQYRKRKIWSLVRLYDRKSNRRSLGASTGSDDGRTSPSVSASSLSLPKASIWVKAEALLEEEPSFGMQFGVLEREVSVNKPAQNSSFLTTAIDVMKVYSGIGFLCNEARPGDKLFLLPGLRYPVVLRPITTDRYHLIGECILRIGKANAKMKDISIQTQA